MVDELPLITRKHERFYADSKKVIARLFLPEPPERVRRICDRVLALPADEAGRLWQEILRDFGSRHEDLPAIVERHYRAIRRHLPADRPLPEPEAIDPIFRQLIGAYFTSEYSVQSAAFFNPSIIPHPNQQDVPADSRRFILSFRATGEGHISSIAFRSGILDRDGNLALEPASPFTATPELIGDPSYDKHTFNLKLQELGKGGFVARTILEHLPEEFTLRQLNDAIWLFGEEYPDLAQHDIVQEIRWLAESNYQVRFPTGRDISERVLFPMAKNEMKGMEDARFVRFEDGDQVIYYATYTAYNGFTGLPQLIETRDFLTFKMTTLNGAQVTDKGMALFPRRITGRFWMLGRCDRENLFVLDSDNLHFWNRAVRLNLPPLTWNLVQVGNCGSPIETQEGWLVLTHGVGPMREYSLGAILLDLEQPTIIRGRLHLPLLSPNDDERDGYVPNVVYTCGAMIHGNDLVIPYAMSDSMSGIATVPLNALIAEILKK